MGAVGDGNLISEANVEKVLPYINSNSEAFDYINALYTEQEKPEKIFSGLYKIFLKAKAPGPYSVITYLFFVKNREQYIPM